MLAELSLRHQARQFHKPNRAAGQRVITMASPLKENGAIDPQALVEMRQALGISRMQQAREIPVDWITLYRWEKREEGPGTERSLVHRGAVLSWWMRATRRLEIIMARTQHSPDSP